MWVGLGEGGRGLKKVGGLGEGPEGKPGASGHACMCMETRGFDVENRVSGQRGYGGVVETQFPHNLGCAPCAPSAGDTELGLSPGLSLLVCWWRKRVPRLGAEGSAGDAGGLRTLEAWQWTWRDSGIIGVPAAPWAPCQGLHSPLTQLWLWVLTNVYDRQGGQLPGKPGRGEGPPELITQQVSDGAGTEPRTSGLGALVSPLTSQWQLGAQALLTTFLSPELGTDCLQCHSGGSSSSPP